MRKRNTPGSDKNRRGSSSQSDNRKRSGKPPKKEAGGSYKKRSEEPSSGKKRPPGSRPNAPAKRTYTSSAPKGGSRTRSSKDSGDDRYERKTRFGKSTDGNSGEKRSPGSRPNAPTKRTYTSSAPKGGSRTRSSKDSGDDRYERKTRFGKYTDENSGEGKSYNRSDSRGRGKRDDGFTGKRGDSRGESKRSPSTRRSGDSAGNRDERKSRFGKEGQDDRSANKRSFTKRDDSPKRDQREDRTEKRGFSESRKKADRPYRSRSSERFDEAPVQTEQIRLNRFIANSGVCSRREADELIGMGLISVNGKTITEMGYKVNPGDEVRYEDRVLKAEKPVYILMNKPKGYLTTTDDPQERNTVMHIIGNAVKERVYPVGRLDRNTTGLLLLTNDGDLADKLMHPSYNVKKIYKVELDKPLTKADFQRLQEGIQLEEGRAQVDDAAIISPDGRTVGVELHIGWNRVVRRIFEAMEYQVVKLDRSVYAGLDKKELPRGHWRFLKREEIIRLKHYK